MHDMESPNQQRLRESTEQEVAWWKRMKEKVHPFSWTAAGLLLVALVRMPGWYYRACKLAVCAYAVYALCELFKRGKSWQAVVAAMIAVLFNPLFPVRMGKWEWMGVEVICAVLVLTVVRLPNEEKKGE